MAVDTEHTTQRNTTDSSLSHNVMCLQFNINTKFRSTLEIVIHLGKDTLHLPYHSLYIEIPAIKEKVF